MGNKPLCEALCGINETIEIVKKIKCECDLKPVLDAISKLELELKKCCKDINNKLDLILNQFNCKDHECKNGSCIKDLSNTPK